MITYSVDGEQRHILEYNVFIIKNYSNEIIATKL